MKAADKSDFQAKFKNASYGSMYPESSVIRIYEHFYKKTMGKTSENKSLLDFGCGTGTHSVYFAEKGFDTYGIDISDAVIDRCENLKSAREGTYPGNLHFQCIDVLDETVAIENIFDTKFDVIFSNHVLYHFSPENCETLLTKFNNALKPNGIVIFTMITEKSFFHDYVVEEESEGPFKKVILKTRNDDAFFVTFTKDMADLCDKFKLYKKLYTGSYDFEFTEGSSEHYYFIGEKK